ncbi:MAG: hypothetical protein AB1552_09205 [Nitrospirota bacterium]
MSVARPAFSAQENAGRKGVNLHGNQESSEEGNKEDRKEEISFLYTRIYIFMAGGEILQPSFCGLHRYETLF